MSVVQTTVFKKRRIDQHFNLVTKYEQAECTEIKQVDHESSMLGGEEFRELQNCLDWCKGIGLIRFNQLAFFNEKNAKFCEKVKPNLRT